MPTVLSTMLPPLHLLLYSTLLGTQIYQSFIVVKIAHRALSSSAFTTLQKRLFPAYFQTTFLFALGSVVTWPYWGGLMGIEMWRAESAWDLALLGAEAGVAGINWVWLGRRVGEVMIERVHQESRDGRKYTELEGQSLEMQILNKRFRKWHAASIHINVIGLVATVAYGFLLGRRMGQAL